MSGTITTPPSAGFASTPFSDAEKADVRRFCGYPPFGSGTSQIQQSWRFFQVYGLMEYRMSNMAPAEYQNIRYILAQLYPLESAIWGASEALGTEQAAVWTRNANEVADRTKLFNQIRKSLAALLGVPPGPQLGSGFSVVV